jgi:hypothetical protein
MLLGSVFLPLQRKHVDAQNAPAVFDEIVCHNLRVVDAEGKPLVNLRYDKDGGIVTVDGKNGMGRAGLSMDVDGGVVGLIGKNEAMIKSRT